MLLSQIADRLEAETMEAVANDAEFGEAFIPETEGELDRCRSLAERGYLVEVDVGLFELTEAGYEAGWGNVSDGTDSVTTHENSLDWGGE
jgi:hypothetical protein